jgi:hypothetical protein
VKRDQVVELCTADDGDGITCACHLGHAGPHWSSVWDLSGVGIYHQEWSDFPLPHSQQQRGSCRDRPNLLASPAQA